jgi:hypothetical protein
MLSSRAMTFTGDPHAKKRVHEYSCLEGHEALAATRAIEFDDLLAYRASTRLTRSTLLLPFVGIAARRPAPAPESSSRSGVRTRFPVGLVQQRLSV